MTKSGKRFVKRLGEAREGWQIHDYYLMSGEWICCCREGTYGGINAAGWRELPT
jgi:hypothetical protein